MSLWNFRPSSMQMTSICIIQAICSNWWLAANLPVRRLAIASSYGYHSRDLVHSYHTILQDYSGDYLWSGRTVIQVYFCEVQNYMDLMGPSYPQKNHVYCVTVIRLCHQNVWPQNHFHLPKHKNFNCRWFHHWFHQDFINFSPIIAYVVINNRVQVNSCGWALWYVFISS